MNSSLRAHWSDLILNARRFAHKYHGDQKYSQEFPYTMHLQATESVLLRFGITDPELRAAAWLHDVLEDTTATYENVALFFGDRIADIVSAVTEPKGGNRKWRHEQTYPRIRESADAVIVKLADRIANVEASGNKFYMYVKEYPEFKNQLWHQTQKYPECYYPNDECDKCLETIYAMWTYLDSLMMEE